MRYGCIYKATNLINNKCYIGQTLNFIKRYNKHMQAINNNSNLHFHSSVRKYGLNNFQWEIIQDSIPENLMDIVEIYQIAIHRSFYNGLNETMGGEGGVKSNKTKEKMSKSRLGKSSPRKGVILSEEIKKKQSLARLGKKFGSYKRINKEDLLKSSLQFDFNKDKVSESLICDEGTISRLLKSFGYLNWIDFKNKHKG